MTKISVKDNYDAAHKFFYGAPENTYYFYQRCTCDFTFKDEEYCGNRLIADFHSYYTTIGQLVINSKGQSWLLISSNSMSHTTAKHLNILRSACPISNIIYIPYDCGDRPSLESVNKRLQEYVNGALELNISTGNNRRQIKYAFLVMCETIKHLDFSYTNDDIEALTALYHKSQDIEAIKQAQAANRKNAIEKRKQTLLKQKADTQRYNELIQQYGYLKVIAGSFDYTGNVSWLQTPDRNVIREKLLKQGYSLIWLDKVNQVIRTSQRVTVPIQEVYTLLKLWKAGKLKHGMQCQQYVIRSVMPEFVQCGCHKIPAENLEALYVELHQYCEKQAA